MLRKVYLSIFLLSLTAVFTGCMNLGNVSYKQARMLKKEGFELQTEGWTLALPERLLFSFDDYHIQNQQNIKLTNLSKQLKKYELDKLKFTGHSDNIGQASYNQQLSQKRAQSVADIFLAQGFQSNNLQVLGRGADQPIASNNTEEGRAKNRRVNITIIP